MRNFNILDSRKLCRICNRFLKFVTKINSIQILPIFIFKCHMCRVLLDTDEFQINTIISCKDLKTFVHFPLPCLIWFHMFCFCRGVISEFLFFFLNNIAAQSLLSIVCLYLFFVVFLFIMIFSFLKIQLSLFLKRFPVENTPSNRKCSLLCLQGRIFL